ncbi:hypothetical protein [Amycolatopsis lexingtonensis]|uniref:hypothetical protein n=1 Tax=Amycolatopsis lexingtonensis TaxID=218822 RepID=UPI003F6F4F86
MTVRLVSGPRHRRALHPAGSQVHRRLRRDAAHLTLLEQVLLVVQRQHAGQGDAAVESIGRRAAGDGPDRRVLGLRRWVGGVAG